MSSDSDDGGGSFWTTFGGTLAGGPEASTLEQLLQTPGCKVEALLEEEEVLQEFKAGNEKLVARLCEPDASRALIELVTLEPPDSASSSRCFRYPFVAVELMSCGPPAFFEALVRPDHSETLDALWSFLEACPPVEINPVLAGYFSRTAALILTKHPVEVVEYLKRRGPDMLLERFLERLHLRSVAELFARLLCAEQLSRVLFPMDSLAPRLLARLQDGCPSSDTQENITLVILELLAHKDSLCCSDELLQQLTEEPAVAFLVNHIFSGRTGSVSAASSILSSVVFHTYIAFKGVDVTASTPTLSPLSPPQVSLVGEDDVVTMSVDESSMTEVAPAFARAHHSSPPVSPQSHGRAGNPRWLEARSMSLMREICQHLPRVRELLDAALGQNLQISTPIGEVSAVSSTTLEVINLVAMLVRTGCPTILEAVLREQLMPRCLEVFFRHPWSTLLHNSVKVLLSEVMTATDGVRPSLVLTLIREGGLAGRLVAEYQAEEESHIGERKRFSRVGYMGHLHAICCELREFGLQVPECGTVLMSLTGWSDVVLPALDATQRLLSENLGGGIPREDRGLASSKAIGSTACLRSSSEVVDAVSSSLEADFVLDDLSDDLDDIDDPAERGKRHRPAFADSVAPAYGQQANSADLVPPLFPVLGTPADGAPTPPAPLNWDATPWAVFPDSDPAAILVGGTAAGVAELGSVTLGGISVNEEPFWNPQAAPTQPNGATDHSAWAAFGVAEATAMNTPQDTPVGAENVFALLGYCEPLPAAPLPVASGTPAPAAPVAEPPSGGSSGSRPPQARPEAEPSTGGPVLPASWVAEFDPYFQPGAVSALSAAVPGFPSVPLGSSASVSVGQRGNDDLAFLAPLWPTTGAESSAASYKSFGAQAEFG